MCSRTKYILVVIIVISIVYCLKTDIMKIEIRLVLDYGWPNNFKGEKCTIALLLAWMTEKEKLPCKELLFKASKGD